ncbi:tail tape measure protein, TP901 family [Marvinbryantia formatexigens DSM 14469]|uniref:Tail tape measure protein, TP901 family n=1 Tax=Marvinbryantia formatexigens DSM 14469 TaxID=478749 RepID=C6LLZ6_9FIRM|nr:hypothetical protein [Marvinbryantia formatexigens]EET58359.1 tail tape measure protein, TP901 family [Marvinbryantia formatexigens DSM 14469]
MASRIKGITIEIGGDTTGLDKALKSVNSSITHTQSALKDVNKLLKLDPANTETEVIKRCHFLYQGKTGCLKTGAGTGKGAAGEWRLRAGQIRCPPA